MENETYNLVLKKYFGYDSFRGIQLDIIQSIHHGHDTLGLMLTGGGKSITFQIPALLMEGVCLVITPLISLMNDQVASLKRRGITAECIHSGLTHDEVQRILDNTIYGAVKFLYISPERIASQLFQAKLYYMKVCFITIDEAHCISQWGYDFRPSYLEVAKIREMKPAAPVLALTATATPGVITDIQSKLLFDRHEQQTGLPSQFFTMSFRRDNLSYIVRRTEDKVQETYHILHSVPGSAIVYTRSRKQTKELAEILNAEGITATYYHAGLDFAIKDSRQKEWSNGDVRVMVATNAFGMGVDKPDVRLVIHFSSPDSIEAYFQEAGRAGRDGKRSYVVLLYNDSDISKLLQYPAKNFPDKDYIRNVYDDMAYYFELAVDSGEGAQYEFDIDRFCINFHHYPSTVENALAILQNAGYIHYDPERDTQPRVMISMKRNELYDIQGLTPTEDSTLTTLLRYYGSLFSELTYISTGLIAEKCGISERQLHLSLKSLAQRGILRYVPRRTVPVITYQHQRIYSTYLKFGREIYEDLRQRMEQRIEAVVQYITTPDRCRSQMLLEYFGETDATPCHCCDTCISQKAADGKKQQAREADIRQKVMSLLADRKEHSFDELRQTGIDDNLLIQLREEELIIVDPPYIKLNE